MRREELEILNRRGGAFFDRVALWLREESGEELAEILGVERGWGDWTGFYHVQIVTTENLYHNVDISLPWFGAGKRPYLGPFYETYLRRGAPLDYIGQLTEEERNRILDARQKLCPWETQQPR